MSILPVLFTSDDVWLNRINAMEHHYINVGIACLPLGNGGCCITEVKVCTTCSEFKCKNGFFGICHKVSCVLILWFVCDHLCLWHYHYIICVWRLSFRLANVSLSLVTLRFYIVYIAEFYIYTYISVFLGIRIPVF